jgi:hypothetical protein
MPRRLIDRCREDSIREFRLAAWQRFDDALALAAAGQRTGAIYLWGYTAEMILKAAYFSLLGMGETDVITWGGHLRPAIDRGRLLGIAWPYQGAGHNIRAWAELLVLERASSPATAYAVPFGREVQRQGQLFEPLWRETLRYRKNDAYLYEVRQVREATEWFLVRLNQL